MDMPRCVWAGGEPMRSYHDNEWGVPLHDDRRLFEFLVLEGAQAGLSFATILRRREGYRTAFAGFDPVRVAGFGAGDEARLLGDVGIIRNRLKIRSAINNASRFLEVQEEFGSFDRYLWGYVDGRQVNNRFTEHTELPDRTPVSARMSADLRRRGFTFVGPVICYALMQAVGMVNDHTLGCFRNPRW